MVINHLLNGSKPPTSEGLLQVPPRSKECQVTIIRTKRINDWPYWQRVYPKCQASTEDLKWNWWNTIVLPWFTLLSISFRDLQLYCCKLCCESSMWLDVITMSRCSWNSWSSGVVVVVVVVVVVIVVVIVLVLVLVLVVVAVVVVLVLVLVLVLVVVVLLLLLLVILLVQCQYFMHFPMFPLWYYSIYSFWKRLRMVGTRVAILSLEAGVATVIKRAAEQGKLEGRNKIQFLSRFDSSALWLKCRRIIYVLKKR